MFIILPMKFYILPRILHVSDHDVSDRCYSNTLSRCSGDVEQEPEQNLFRPQKKKKAWEKKAFPDKQEITSYLMFQGKWRDAKSQAKY